MDEGKIPAEQAVHDLTLALLYLNRFTDSRMKRYEDPPLKAWKSYDWDALDKFNEEDFIIDNHGNKSLYLTDEGVVRAKEILEQYGIADWEKEGIKKIEAAAIISSSLCMNTYERTGRHTWTRIRIMMESN